MRTFIFGAGASVHAGYPLASRMWPALAGWTLESFSPDSLFRGVVEEMNSRFDMTQPFELVLTDLQQRIETLVRKADISDAERIEKHTLLQLPRAVEHMIGAYFNTIRCQPAELYDSFASELLTPGDAIITFNYDVGLDRSLRLSGKWSVRDGYGFEIEGLPIPLSQSLLLKLHGSTNWHGELFGGMEGFGQWSGPSLGARPVVDRAEFEYLGYSGISDPSWHNGRVRIESLIMPTAKKQFYKETSLGREWLEFWDSLWDQAEHALKMSNEIYIVGYSLPNYDARARGLLRRGIPSGAQVNVCCDVASGSIIRSLKQLGVVNAVPCNGATFREFLSGNRSAVSAA